MMKFTTVVLKFCPSLTGTDSGQCLTCIQSHRHDCCQLEGGDLISQIHQGMTLEAFFSLVLLHSPLLARGTGFLWMQLFCFCSFLCLIAVCSMFELRI